MDIEAGALLDQRMRSDPEYSMALVDGLGETERPTWAWLNVQPRQDRVENVVCFSTGFGDGVYPTFYGLDSHDAIVALVTDFLVLDRDDLEPGGSAVVAPSHAATRQRGSPWRFWERRSS
jgi:hypothetical protein